MSQREDEIYEFCAHEPDDEFSYCVNHSQLEDREEVSELPGIEVACFIDLS